MRTLSSSILHHQQGVSQPPGCLAVLVPHLRWAGLQSSSSHYSRVLSPDLVITRNFYHSITHLKTPYTISRSHTLALRSLLPVSRPHTPLQNPIAYLKTLYPVLRIPTLSQDSTPHLQSPHSIPRLPPHLKPSYPASRSPTLS